MNPNEEKVRMEIQRDKAVLILARILEDGNLKPMRGLIGYGLSVEEYRKEITEYLEAFTPREEPKS